MPAYEGTGAQTYREGTRELLMGPGCDISLQHDAWVQGKGRPQLESQGVGFG